MAILMAVGVVLPTAAADAACATGHVRFKLSGLDSTAAADPFYLAVEPSAGAVDKRFTIEAHGDVCYRDVSVDYAAVAGTASSADFDAKRDTATMRFGDHTAPPFHVDVPIKSDGATDAVVESVNVGLSNPQNGGLGSPTAAPMFIVDVDGATSRVALDGRAFERREGDGAIHIPVFRAGPTTSSTTVSYSLEGSGSDPAETSDFSDATGGTVTFTGSDRMEMIGIALTRDNEVESSEALTVRLTAATADTTIAPAQETTVTIHDGAEGLAPTSRLHHPRQGLRYKRDDYRLREMHIFTADQGGSSVVRAELALRRNMKGGRCAWWNGKRFRGGACGDERWISLPSFEPDFFYHRIGSIRPSMGTKIKNYTAFSRAVDGAGNVESAFEKGRNANTFEVKRGKRRR